MVGEEFEIITSEKHLALNVINPLTETIYFVYSITWYHWHNQKVRNEIVDNLINLDKKWKYCIIKPYSLLCHSSYFAIE